MSPVLLQPLPSMWRYNANHAVFFRLFLSIPDIKIIILSCYSLQAKGNSIGTIKLCKTKCVSSQTGLIIPLPDKKADHQSRNKHIHPEGKSICISIIRNYSCSRRSCWWRNLMYFSQKQSLNGTSMLGFLLHPLSQYNKFLEVIVLQ